MTPVKTQKPKQPTPDEQSGSTGRPAVDDTQPAGPSTGQGQYGQSGLGGADTETDGEARYRNSANKGDVDTKQTSNPGSGRGDADETRRKVTPPAPKR